MKPCVSSFGGDQFEEGQEEALSNFFGFFYFAINAGSLVSTFVSPIMREEVKCFDRDVGKLSLTLSLGLEFIQISLGLLFCCIYGASRAYGYFCYIICRWSSLL